MKHTVLATVLLALGAPAAFAQCNKPTIPANGLPTRSIVDQTLTYSDGYKTLVNLTLPASPVPSCAWPLIVHVHGYGGRRSLQPAIARRGYAVVTYDVRGQGTAKTLNPSTSGMTFYGATEKYDLAELIAFARRTWPTLVSSTRLGVTGGSQGGIHSCFAAAYSGRTIAIAGRGSIRFPNVNVAAPTAFVPDVLDHVVRERSLFSMDALERIEVSTAAILDPQLKQQYRTRFLAQDPAGLLASLENEPDRPVRPLFATMRTPLLFQMAWLDGVQHPTEALDALRSIPATTPMQAMLSTLGHGSPANGHVATRNFYERIRWFDRFLWGEANGAGTEARFVTAAQPVLFTDLQDRQRVWPERHTAQFPPRDSRPLRLYLSPGSTLTTQVRNASSVAIQHRVAAGYDAANFLSSRAQRTLQTVLTRIPLSSQRFRSAAVQGELEIAGSARLRMRVTPSASRFHLSALLFAIVPGQSERYMLASWGKGVLTATPNVARDFEVELSPSVNVLPSGTRFELEIRNHWMRESPGQRALKTAPYFASCDTSIALGGSAQVAASIEIPTRARVAASLASRLVTTTVRNPSDVSIDLDASRSRAGNVYVVFASLSGQSPGLALPGGLLRLQPDALTDLMLQLANGPVAPMTVGVLSAQGSAQPRINLSSLAPLPPELVGARMTFAAWVLDTSASLQGAASNPIDVLLR